MASFIDPRCAVPVYLLDNEDVATSCGRLSGVVISVLITIMIIAASILLYMKKDENDPEGKNKRPTVHIGVTVCIILMVWLLIPFLSGYFNKVSFRGKGTIFIS